MRYIAILFELKLVSNRLDTMQNYDRPLIEEIGVLIDRVSDENEELRSEFLSAYSQIPDSL